MATFILKTEPGTYSYEDLVRQKRAVWDGISNNAALAHLRTAREGEEALLKASPVIARAMKTRGLFVAPQVEVQTTGSTRSPALHERIMRVLRRAVFDRFGRGS